LDGGRIQEPERNGAAIESLRQERARRRCVTIAAYRDFIQAIADPAEVTFEKALQVISDFERMLRTSSRV